MPEPGDDTPEEDGLGPTPWWFLAAVAVVGFGLGWGFELLTVWLWGAAPTVPWTSPAVLGLMAVLVGATARQTHRRLHVQHGRLDSRRAFNLVLMAKASCLVGALVAGGYLGFGLQFVDSLDTALPRERVVRSAVCVVLGVLVLLAGKVLEHACRLPDDPDEPDTGRDGARA